MNWADPGYRGGPTPGSQEAPPFPEVVLSFEVDAEGGARQARLRVLFFESDWPERHFIIDEITTPPLEFPEGRPCYTATLEPPSA